MKLSGHELGKELLEVLKLPKRTIWFELRCAVDELATITCGYALDAEKGRIKEIIRKYRLEKIKLHELDVHDRLTRQLDRIWRHK